MFLFFQAAKEAKARIPPWEMFKHETDKYSKFDEQVRVPFFRYTDTFMVFQCNLSSGYRLWVYV